MLPFPFDAVFGHDEQVLGSCGARGFDIGPGTSGTEDDAPGEIGEFVGNSRNFGALEGNPQPRVCANHQNLLAHRGKCAITALSVAQNDAVKPRVGDVAEVTPSVAGGSDENREK